MILPFLLILSGILVGTKTVKFLVIVTVGEILVVVLGGWVGSGLDAIVAVSIRKKTTIVPMTSYWTF